MGIGGSTGPGMAPIILTTDIRVFKKVGNSLHQTGCGVQAGKQVEISSLEEVVEYDHQMQVAAQILNFEFSEGNPEVAYVLKTELIEASQ